MATLKTSESLDQLAPALLAAQREVENPTQNAENTFHHNTYADLNAVIAAVVPVFNKHGLAVSQFVSGQTLVTLLTHESGQFIITDGDGELPTGKPGPQAFGSALTYLRRYTLQALAGVSSEKDDDAEGATAPRTKQTKRTSPPVKAEW